MGFKDGHKQSNSGRTHFCKGHIPWNKGKKGVQVSWNKGHKGLKPYHNLSGLQTKEAKEKSRLSRIGKVSGFKNKRHSKEAIEQNRQKHLGKKAWNKGLKGFGLGHPNYVRDPEQRKINARLGSLALFNKKGPTSIEKRLYDFLNKIGIAFEKQKLINNKFIVDAYIPEINLIIEADGTYWHSLPTIINKDKAENAYLKKCGYHLLRLTESEIMENNYEYKILKWL